MTRTFVLALVLALACVRTTSAQGLQNNADSERSEPAGEARTHFARAGALFERENYDAALAEFQRVYDLMSGSARRYVVLFNIAQCHERLFRYDQALVYYRRYLEEGGPAAEDHINIEATMRALEGLLATVRIRTNVSSAEVWVDERQIGTAPGTIRIPGGHHVLQLRARGYLPTQQEIELPARASRTLTIALEVVPRGRRISPVLFFTAAGITAASAGVGAAFGIRALVVRGQADAQGQNPDPAVRLDPERSELRHTIRTSAVTADILYGTAVLFAAGAGVLFFFTDWQGGGISREQSRHPANTSALWPAVTSHSAELLWTGSF